VFLDVHLSLVKGEGGVSSVCTADLLLATFPSVIVEEPEGRTREEGSEEKYSE
jgi:hypothetical protein